MYIDETFQKLDALERSILFLSKSVHCLFFNVLYSTLKTRVKARRWSTIANSKYMGSQLRWLERTPDKREVDGSIPFEPTILTYVSTNLK